MTFDLQKILDILNYISFKEGTGNTFTQNEYNTMLPVASQMLFNRLYSDFEKRQAFTDALLPFKKFMGQDEYVNNGVIIPAIPPLFIDSSGYAPIPDDYVHYSAIQYKKVTNKPNCELKVSHRKVIPVTDQQFDAYDNYWSVKHASHSYPVCNFQNGFIRFIPKNLQYVNFVYLRKPVVPFYGGAIDQVNDVFVYDPLLSVQLEWRNPEIIEIIGLLASQIGINLTNTQLFQYAEMVGKEEVINKSK